MRCLAKRGCCRPPGRSEGQTLRQPPGYGLEVGGAIGIPLFLSQAMSVGFYVIGFIAAVNEAFPDLDTTWLAVGVVLIFGLLAYLGADFVLRIQFVVLGALGLALISFFAGGWGAAIEPSWGASNS